MANLIPPQAQKNISREYLLRVISVCSYAAAAGLFITVILMSPVLVLVQSQISAFSQQYASAEDISADFKSAETQLRDSSTISRLLLEETNYLPVSVYLSKLHDEFSGRAVNLSYYNFTGYENVFAISGVAINREELARFKSTLENSGYFSRVELPISSLASETDINFSMNLYLVANENKD